jgi:hypothetical protein
MDAVYALLNVGVMSGDRDKMSSVANGIDAMLLDSISPKKLLVT